MEEIWLVSQGSGASKTPALLRWWWGFLLIDGMLSVASAMGARLGEPEPAGFVLVNAVTGITTSVLLMLIIRRVTAMQLERRASGPLTAAEPLGGGGILSDLASS